MQEISNRILLKSYFYPREHIPKLEHRELFETKTMQWHVLFEATSIMPSWCMRKKIQRAIPKLYIKWPPQHHTNILLPASSSYFHEKMGEALSSRKHHEIWTTEEKERGSITHLSTKSFASFRLDVVSSSDFDRNIMTYKKLPLESGGKKTNKRSGVRKATKRWPLTNLPKATLLQLLSSIILFKIYWKLRKRNPVFSIMKVLSITIILWVVKRMKIPFTSVKIFKIASLIFIFGKLPSGRGSSQFFRRVSTPWSKNSCWSCFLWRVVRI